MEESYQLAVKRETVHNIHSYSYELEHLISRHSDAFQGKGWGTEGQGWLGQEWMGMGLLLMDAGWIVSYLVHDVAHWNGDLHHNTTLADI